jgi:phenylacetic acid degradation operon negative regulatory protein
VLASTLLGSDPPRLPVSFLVRTGALFGMAEGTVRTALSRMTAAGDLRTDGDGWYELTDTLDRRRRRQELGRSAPVADWSGRWWVGVVGAAARPPRERALLRRRMEQGRLAELREGVWVRPDNLDPDPRESDEVGQCLWFVGHPALRAGQDEAELATDLWPLDRWAERAVALRRLMHSMSGRLESGDTSALAPGFLLSAAVLRHFVADPLLPPELLPRRWPGTALRSDYERYDAAYRALLRDWSTRPLDT